MKEIQSAYTLKSLLEELKNTMPKFEVGQIFETLKPIYPPYSIPRHKKNILYEEISFTKPLALDSKSKKEFLKEKSPIKKFFKNFSRGDFLKIVETDGTIAKCINLSLNEEIVNKFYKNETIEINFAMIANGTIKQFKKKLDKYL